MMMQARTHFWSEENKGAKKRRTRRTTRALMRLDNWEGHGMERRKQENSLFKSFHLKSLVSEKSFT